MATPIGIYLKILSPIVRLVLAVGIVAVAASMLGYPLTGIIDDAIRSIVSSRIGI